MNDALIQQLRGRYQEGRLVPFVGAGVSMAVTWEADGRQHRGPSWSEVVDHACHLLGFETPELLRARGTDLQILEYFGVKRHAYGELTTWLAREFDAPDEALLRSRIHGALAALSKCTVYYTTNFDDFLERALRLHGRSSQRIAVEANIANALQQEARSSPSLPTCQVVKFHGDLTNPEQMVLSESNYEDRLQLASTLDHRLRADLLGRALLFLGYSFRDPNVAYLFRRLTTDLGQLPESASGHRAYIAVTEPSDFEILLFRERHIQVIPISASHPAEDIANLLEDISRA